MKVTLFLRNPFEIGNFSIEAFYGELEIQIKESVNFTVKRLPFKNKGIIPRIINIIYCYLNQSDVNHIVGDISYCALLMNKKKLILTVLDFVSLYNSKGLKYYIFKKFLYELPIMKSKEVIYISESTQKDSEKFLLIKRSSKVIPVTVHRDFFKLEHSQKNFNKNFLIIGTAPNKNINRIISAIEGIDCNLTIIGKLDHNQRKKLNSLKINFFEYKNALPISDVINLYKESDILIYVSELEGFGMPIIEANLAGVCVLTSNISSMPFVAGNSAYLVDPFDIDSIHDGLNELCNNSTLRKQLIKNGFINSKRFLIKNIAEQHIKLYK